MKKLLVINFLISILALKNIFKKSRSFNGSNRSKKVSCQTQMKTLLKFIHGSGKLVVDSYQ